MLHSVAREILLLFIVAEMIAAAVLLFSFCYRPLLCSLLGGSVVRTEQSVLFLLSRLSTIV